MTLAPLKAGIRTPYGEARSTGTVVTTNTQRYIGAYQEAANLYKLGARFYDATTTGRFTQFDPAGQEPNPYSYAGCNPINSSDPSGTLTKAQQCGLAFVGIGLLVGALIAAIPAGFALTAAAATATGTSTGLGLAAGVIIGVAGVFGC